jgi:hypothetical protein
MEQEPLHWSERAKAEAPGAFPPASLGGRPPHRPRDKRTLLTIGSIILVVAVAAVALVIMLPRFGMQTAADTTAPQAGGHVETTAGNRTLSTEADARDSTPTTAGTTSTTMHKSPVTSIYSQAGIYRNTAAGVSFQYPKTWKQFPVNGAADPGDPTEMAFGVADPKGGQLRSIPLDYIIAGAGLFTDEELARGPEALVQEMVDTWADPVSTHGAAEILEPVKRTEINGMPAAETIIRYVMGDLNVIERVCLVVSGHSGCVLVMCTEQKYKKDNWPLFEQTLKSLQLNASTIEI